MFTRRTLLSTIGAALVGSVLARATAFELDSQAWQTTTGAPAIQYSDWLRWQPDSLQDAVLGPAAARRFRAGEDAIEAIRNERAMVKALKPL